MLPLIITALAGVILSYLGVAIFRRWSHDRQLFDIPNDRSSHTEPTPRGGGLIIVLISLAAYMIGAFWAGAELSIGFVVAAVLVAAVSWLDDIRSLSFLVRFVVHAIAAAVVIFDIGYWNMVAIPTIPGAFELGIFGPVLTGLWIVWVINAYNFMDGIDGIAGTQAVIAGIAWGGIAYLVGAAEIAAFAFGIVGSSIGFLFHNWQPAKIFMGDVGSAYLGFVFAVLPFLFKGRDPGIEAYSPLLAVAIIWMFVFDTVWTFFRRSLRMERVWTAHREHLYQRLVRSGWNHRAVTVLYAICAGIIAFLAVWSVFDSGARTWLVLVAIGVISLIVLIFVEFKKRIDLSAQKC